MQSNVTYYCLNRTNGNGTTPTNCAEATQAEVDQLTSSMAACFKTATAAGMNIAVSPHLDDGLGLGERLQMQAELWLAAVMNSLHIRDQSA